MTTCTKKKILAKKLTKNTQNIQNKNILKDWYLREQTDSKLIIIAKKKTLFFLFSARMTDLVFVLDIQVSNVLLY